jgi:hypothetical protein
VKTHWEQQVATRCKLLFEPERPFTFYLFRPDQVEGFLKPKTLVKLARGRIGTVVLWGWVWQWDYQENVGTIPTKEGRIEVRDAGELRELIDYIHAAGMRVASHIHPGCWRDAGLNGMQLVEELERQRKMWDFDGIHFDGADIGNNWIEAFDTLHRLRNRGWWINLHSTIVPFMDSPTGKPWEKCTPHERAENGRIWVVPETSLVADGILWGETMPGPKDNKDIRRYLKWLSAVDRIPHVLPTYYPSKESILRGHAPLFFPILAELGLGHYTSMPELNTYLRLYIGMYEVQRAKYLADPDGYVRDKAREW